jgi:transcriptional regulator with XRE-family HTH domain
MRGKEYAGVMTNKYSEALAAFLKGNKMSQAKFAREIGCSQTHVCHFTQGKRFPNKDTARKIEAETAGQVPLNLWQIAAIERAGIY